jgi:hypothetical protein
MGSVATEGCDGLPLFISQTRNTYLYHLNLLPMEGGAFFDLVQGRAPFGKPDGDAENQGFSAYLPGERKLFEACRVKGFVLRFLRGEAVHLKLDIWSGQASVVYPYAEIPVIENEERFSGDCVTYRINGTEYKNIYGLTLSAKKEDGTKTELWIKRSLQQGPDLPGIIEEMTITAQLMRDKYEYRHFGTFRITLTRLILTADETDIDCADGVIGPLRYYVAGTVKGEVFTSTGEALE